MISPVLTTSKGELLAMCKLVQMVANHHQHEKITPELWKEYLMSSLGIDEDTALHFINRSRRMANRTLDAD